MNISSKVIG